MLSVAKHDLRIPLNAFNLMPKTIITAPVGFTISTDPAQLDIMAIHRFLSEDSYWARYIPLVVVERSITNSLCFGIYDANGRQAAFARVVTDRATFAWLCDVFVLPVYRGQGLSKWLVQSILAYSDLQGLRRHLLATLDAHGLYQLFGYQLLAQPERWLEIRHPDPYPAP
jgi:GNAT superfamily N-acetyltransferase